MSGELLAGLAIWTWSARAASGVRLLLAPAALAYGGVVALRNRAYDRGWLRVDRVPAHVISVGNLRVGGTGKTPTVLWLAGRLAASGRRVAIVARGYGKRRRGVVVVSRGTGPLVSAAEGGDEAVMLARRFAGPVVTAERRVDAASVACGDLGCDTLVLDDGFQHRSLARDADLVLVADEPGRTRLLPAGPFREPVTALARASAVLAVGDAGPSDAGGAPCFRARVVPEALVRVTPGGWRTEPLDAMAGAAVLAVSGVARPERFLTTLVGAGASVGDAVTFPDHHRYGPADVARLRAAARERPIVTTEKDLDKLVEAGLTEVRALRVGLVVEDGDRLLALVVGARAVASHAD